MAQVIPIREPTSDDGHLGSNVAIGFLVWVVFPIACIASVYLTVEAFAWLIRHLWVIGTFGSV